MENFKVSLNGTQINVSANGEIKNKAVIFLHGNSLSSEVFSAQSFSFPVVTIDLPGHGRSQPAEKPEETYSMPGYAKVIGDVIAQLGLKEYILAGHSLGGHIAVNAAKDLDSLKGLVIFGTPPHWNTRIFGKRVHPKSIISFAFYRVSFRK